MHPTLTRRLATLGLCAAALAAALPAIAQEWPARPVKLIVPFAPGGSADVFGRFLAQRLQEALGQSFVVENRPGGGAVIGTDAVAKSAPDGYTLLVMSNTLPELIKAAKDKPDGMTYASSGPGTPYHTSPASCSSTWPASRSCTSRTRAAAARAPTCSAARST